MLEVVGYEIESHEEEEDRHRETSEHFCALEPKGVTD